MERIIEDNENAINRKYKKLLKKKEWTKTDQEKKIRKIKLKAIESRPKNPLKIKKIERWRKKRNDEIDKYNQCDLF